MLLLHFMLSRFQLAQANDVLDCTFYHKNMMKAEFSFSGHQLGSRQLYMALLVNSTPCGQLG